MAVKQTDCDCSGGRDCDEAACVLGVNNQHPSEVMGNRRAGGREGGRKGPASGFQPVCGCGGGGFGAVGHYLLEPCIR